MLDKLISNILRDLRFSLKPPLKSAADRYTAILQNIEKIYEYVDFSLFFFVSFNFPCDLNRCRLGDFDRIFHNAVFKNILSLSLSLSLYIYIYIYIYIYSLRVCQISPPLKKNSRCAWRRRQQQQYISYSVNKKETATDNKNNNNNNNNIYLTAIGLWPGGNG